MKFYHLTCYLRCRSHGHGHRRSDRSVLHGCPQPGDRLPSSPQSQPGRSTKHISDSGPAFPLRGTARWVLFCNTRGIDWHLAALHPPFYARLRTELQYMRPMANFSEERLRRTRSPRLCSSSRKPSSGVVEDAGCR